MEHPLKVLKQLQGVDGKLFRLRKERQQIPVELEAAQERVAQQQTAVSAVEERLKAEQLAQKEKEVDLQTKEAGIKKLQGQLFQVKTNREYAAMQHEIDALKADSSLLEEAILQEFEVIDQTMRQRQQARQRLAEEQARLQAETTRIELQLATLNEEMGRLEQRRTSLLPNVPSPALELYERVLVNREGLALVPLVDDSCGGCYRRLPPQVVNEVLLSAKLVTCESCNRILYRDGTIGG